MKLPGRSEYTTVPNVYIENQAELTAPGFQVILAICRKTFGFHKDTDSVSISQMMKMTGLSNRCVIDTVRLLEEKGLISVERADRQASLYSLVLKEEAEGSERRSQGLMNDVHKGVVNDVHTQKKQEKKLKDKESFTSRDVTDLFWATFLEKTGMKPVWKEQYQKQAAKLAKEAGRENVRKALALYFEDDWHRKVGWEFGKFYQAFTGLAARVLAKEREKQVGIQHPVLDYEKEELVVSDEMKEGWKQTYVNVDVDVELEKIRVTLLCRESKVEDLGRFITTWLDSHDRKVAR